MPESQRTSSVHLYAVWSSQKGHLWSQVMVATLGLEEESAPVSLQYLYTHPSAGLCTPEDAQQASGSLWSHHLEGSKEMEGKTGRGDREKLLAGDAACGRRINRSRHGATACEPTSPLPTSVGCPGWPAERSPSIQLPKAMLQSISRKQGQLITGINSRQPAARANKLPIDFWLPFFPAEGVWETLLYWSNLLFP